MDKVVTIISNPEDFVIPSVDVEKKVALVLKDVFDNACKVSTKSFGPFDSLIVDNLDIDSIWEEIACRNRPLTRYIQKKISELMKSSAQAIEREKQAKDKAKRKASKQLSKVAEKVDDLDDDGENFIDDEENGDNDMEEGMDENAEDVGGGGGDDDDDDDDIFDDEEDDVDDEISNDNDDANISDFDEDAMEKFLDGMDELEEQRLVKQQLREKKQNARGHKSAIEDEEVDVDDMDLVAGEMYKDDSDAASDNDENDDDDDGESNGIMAADFFGSREGRRGKSLAKKATDKGTKAKKQSRNEQDDEDDDEEDDGDAIFDDVEAHDDYEDDNEDEDEENEDQDEENEDEDGQQLPLTSYQRRKQKLLAQQESLEQSLLAQKSWEMRGEIKSGERPDNSLLEMNTDIERASKPAPVITQLHTSSLEDMILKRILESKFNDIVPISESDARHLHDDDADAAGATALSQEKDKLGLGEIYANEYLAKTMDEASKDQSKKMKNGDDEKRLEIKSLFLKICRQLDGLSHFHFTPKPTIAEGSITVHNLPALMMEEIAPSDNLYAGTINQDAPEAVAHKPRSRVELLPDEERTSQDKNRFRNASKRTRRTSRLRETAAGASAAAALENGHLTVRRGDAQSEKLFAQAKAHSNKRLLDTLKNDKRVILSSDADDAQAGKRAKLTSSSDFFSRLQDSLHAPVNDNKKAKKHGGAAANVSSSRMKL